MLDCTRMVDPFLPLWHLGTELWWHPYRVEHLRLCIPFVSEINGMEFVRKKDHMMADIFIDGSNIETRHWTWTWLWRWQWLTSHFSRISGQFLRISSRVYNAGGAVSSARPLVISDCTKQVMISHLASPSRPQGQATAAKQMWTEMTKTCGEKKGLTRDYLDK